MSERPEGKLTRIRCAYPRCNALPSDGEVWVRVDALYYCPRHSVEFGRIGARLETIELYDFNPYRVEPEGREGPPGCFGNFGFNEELCFQACNYASECRGRSKLLEQMKVEVPPGTRKVRIIRRTRK